MCMTYYATYGKIKRAYAMHKPNLGILLACCDLERGMKEKFSANDKYAIRNRM